MFSVMANPRPTIPGVDNPIDDAVKLILLPKKEN
jgi:hypothetical protein